MKSAIICIRVDEPDYSSLPNNVFDCWEQSVYAGAEEMMADDYPVPLGKPVIHADFVDANLYHNLVDAEKSVTGIMHIFNKTLMDWFSKKQATVETATYGSEFVATRTAIEQIIDLRNILRYILGVAVKGSTMMFGDNESQMPHSTFLPLRLQRHCRRYRQVPPRP
jgi:hypothetical protein